MRVTVDASLNNKFVASGWGADDWLTILYTLRKELKAAASVFPELKDFEIVNMATPAKKRGK